MNYLSGAFRYVARGETEPQNNVPRLIDRIKTSVLPQDRRSAIIELTKVSKASPERQVEVGELGLKVLYAVLEQDVDYDETIRAALDLLIAICGKLDAPQQLEISSEDSVQQSKAQDSNKAFEAASSEAAATNVDVFLGLPNALSLLLQLLEKGDFYVKFGTIELLTAMAANSKQTLQMAVLEAPQGVTRICDLLDDSHRHIRSNAVLLLSTLCEGSSEICKILAFGGVLEKLFGFVDAVLAASGGDSHVSPDDIDDEERLEFAIIVQDVLIVVRNLIKGAKTTKTFFRDTGCLQRLAVVVDKGAKEAGISPGKSENLAPSEPVGLAKTFQKQAKKNIILAMSCITELVVDSDEHTDLIKSDLCNTGLLQALATLAFSVHPNVPDSPAVSESALKVRVSAFRTLGCLIRGHEGLRLAFSNEKCRYGTRSEGASLQVATMNAMLKDSSAAVRLAAYGTLRDSFVADSGLGMPSSAILHSLVETGTTKGLSSSDNFRGSLLSRASNDQSPDDSTSFIATTLKETLVNYPSSSDAAAVFYTASIICWVLEDLQGAKERLLDAQINGSSLLPQVIRCLGKVEREKGASEVRISLLTLICEWLYESPAAVSVFLSSAMHLPMLVDILTSTGVRGDAAEVHTRGLSAVILGICLEATDASYNATSANGLPSDERSSSTVIPRAAVPDVIRNRIGVTVFTSFLDDLRATKAFSLADTHELWWKSGEQLLAHEAQTGLLSISGSAGHEMWYFKRTVDLIEKVYKSVGKRVLDLVADSSKTAVRSNREAPKMLPMNGHMEASGSQNMLEGTLTDSAHDEVINSYKEFIRKQDESLNAAKSQIEELNAALRQAQSELDKVNNVTSNSTTSTEEKKELLAQKEALEALLEEKTVDFEALSNAFTALEAEQQSTSQEPSSENNEEMVAEMQRLKTQNNSLKRSLDTEIDRNEGLKHRMRLLDDSVKDKNVELEALSAEKDALKRNAQPEIVEALQWRTRAEVAESKICSRQELIDTYQNSQATLQDQLREVERTRDEALASAASLMKRFNSTKSELESLRATRRLELQVSREASAASDASALNEIAALKKQLEEERQNLQQEIASKAQGSAAVEFGRFEQMQSEYQAVVNAYEKIKTELTDSRQAVVLWQKRAEISEATRQREGAEHHRITDHATALEGQLKELNDKLLSHEQSSEASKTRAAELEEQCKEIDEIRKHTEEELVVLKEQLASRTEQSIRLSGQLYELEESRERLEGEVEALRASTPSPAANGDKATTGLRYGDTADSIEPSAEIEELQSRLSLLQNELEATQEALAESEEKENLSQDQVRDRDVMLAKFNLLEQDLLTARDEKEKLEAEIGDLREKLMSLDEAEESKRALTMQVVSLQETLAVMEKQSGSPKQNEAMKSIDHTLMIKKLEEEMTTMRARSDEKDMRLSELESSLALALDKAKTAEIEGQDMKKQVLEAETVLSVLQSERDSLIEETEKLRTKVDELTPLAEKETSDTKALQQRLIAAEKMRDTVSEEFASLLAACKLSEKESKQLKDDNVHLNENLLSAKREMTMLEEERQHVTLSRNVNDVITSVLSDASLLAQGAVARQAIENLRLERDRAVADWESSRQELHNVQSEMAKVSALVKERDEAVTTNAEYMSRINDLSKKLVGLQVIANEKEALAQSLSDAKASIADLSEQKAAATTALAELNARVINTKESSANSSKEQGVATGEPVILRRVQELEEALRDAAKTVTATSNELIAAQSLLVDVSADKTAMRTELSAANEEIINLRKQMSDLSATQQTVPALSEISEQDHGFADDTTSSPASTSGGEGSTETSAQSLQTVQAEVSNLRIALERSINEAGSAAELLAKIETKTEEVETKLREARASTRSWQQSAEAFKDEVRELQTRYEEEKASFQRDADAYEARIHRLEEEVEQTKEIWKETLSMSEESWSRDRGQLEKELNDLRNTVTKSNDESSALQHELEKALGEVEVAKGNLDKLELSNQRLSASFRALQDENANLAGRLDKSSTTEESLRTSLQEAKANLELAKESFKQDREAREEHHRVEVKDLEDELDRASSAMERAERVFRDSETSLREQLILERDNLSNLERKYEETKEILRSEVAEKEQTSRLKDQFEAALTDTRRQREQDVSHLKDELNDFKTSLAKKTDAYESATASLRKAETELQKVTLDLKEETEQKTLLEAENYDFLSTIESLESLSKRTKSELAQKIKHLNQTEEKLNDLQLVLQDKEGTLKIKESEVDSKNDEIQILLGTNTSLENEKKQLDETLRKAEESRDSLAQDNKDLLAWVSDLEKRATELQSAASDFQDVEQNLRDALESQRFATEQNSDLVEELRRIKAELSTAQEKLLYAEREKEEAQAERDSSGRRARELEARIREIREKNVAKFSQSEEAIRANANRCADLETALASSERKVAELESVSDDLFGATTSLRQLSEEMNTLRDRALSSEETVQELRKELGAAKSEVVEARKQSSGDAMRSLEAEHNELLVYLADLELEVTNLREELGRP